MRKFYPVISILPCIVNRIRDEFTMCDLMASQPVRHYLSGFHAIHLREATRPKVLIVANQIAASGAKCTLKSLDFSFHTGR